MDLSTINLGLADFIQAAAILAVLWITLFFAKKDAARIKDEEAISTRKAFSWIAVIFAFIGFVTLLSLPIGEVIDGSLTDSRPALLSLVIILIAAWFEILARIFNTTSNSIEN